MRALGLLLAVAVLAAPLAASVPLSPGEDDATRAEEIREAAASGDAIALEVGSATVEDL